MKQYTIQFSGLIHFSKVQFLKSLFSLNRQSSTVKVATTFDDTMDGNGLEIFKICAHFVNHTKMQYFSKNVVIVAVIYDSTCTLFL